MPESGSASPPIRFAGATLDQYRHVCAFFNSPDEERQVMAPFVREGLERGEKAFHIVDPALLQDYLEWLDRSGIPIDALLGSGQFELLTWDEAYLRGGHFDQDRMIQLIEQVLTGASGAGFPLTRLVAHMEWALEDRPGVDDLVEYETRLNYVLPRYKDPVI
jgi:hypothetical protein